jgi:hypothetical protein
MRIVQHYGVSVTLLDAWAVCVYACVTYVNIHCDDVNNFHINFLINTLTGYGPTYAERPDQPLVR